MLKWFRLEDVSTFCASRVDELRPRSSPGGRQALGLQYPLDKQLG